VAEALVPEGIHAAGVCSGQSTRSLLVRTSQGFVPEGNVLLTRRYSNSAQLRSLTVMLPLQPGQH
jgi:hypothetical protein